MPAPTQRVRRGVTLLEVLAVIFIAGVGLLALLTLFPAGLLEMAQAIRDDRQSQLHDVADDLALAGQSLQSTLIQFGGLYAHWLQQGWAEPKDIMRAFHRATSPDDVMIIRADQFRLLSEAAAETAITRGSPIRRRR